jgi:coatomer protein complex subunit alpha (xenin)
MVLKVSEQTPKNKFDIDYDSRNPFRICCLSLTPIYSGSDLIECSYCNASYLPKYENQTCNICKIGCIGKKVQGLFNNIHKFK